MIVLFLTFIHLSTFVRFLSSYLLLPSKLVPLVVYEVMLFIRNINLLLVRVE
jgi:hypothetical protein